MFAILRAFFSGLFSGMAQDQARTGGSPGTLARAKAALAVADQPLTRFAAHAQMAKAMNLGGNAEEMKAHKARALMIFASNLSIGGDDGMRSLKTELEALPQ